MPNEGAYLYSHSSQFFKVYFTCLFLNQNLLLAHSERSSKRPLETHLILLENITEGGGWHPGLTDVMSICRIQSEKFLILCKLCLNLISSTPAPNFCPWLYFYVNQEKGVLGKEGNFYFPRCVPQLSLHGK